MSPLVPDRAESTVARIVKQPATLTPPPHLLDYAATCAAFSWTQAAAWLDGLPGGRGLNIAHEAVDRHLLHGRGAKTAIRWLGKDGQRRELSFTDLARDTSRFANMLASLGVQAGERVFILMGRVPELYVAVLGALKARCVVTPLFSAFGPEPIATRAEIAQARVLVTTGEIYRRKVRGLRARLAGLRHVIVVGDSAPDPEVLPWEPLMASAADGYEIAPTDPEDMALLHFTSGTTGRPKGAVHVHAAVVAHMATGRYALDL
ncbi:MAG TPA: AMP-binding protein, partial [Ramlibacter sp.]